MKKLLFVLLPVFILILGFAGCDKNGEEIKKDSFVHFGDIFTIKINDSVALAPVNHLESNDSILIVCFKKLLLDGRCPKSLCELCYGSRADIQISITQNDEVSDIDLSIWGCIDEENENGNAYKDTLGCRFRLLKLDPYPDIEQINQSDYKSKLKITKL
jgi:hypothetical protein